VNLDSQTQAVMLLTVSFGKSDKSSVKPLSTKEWGRINIWLKGNNLEASTLLLQDGLRRYPLEGLDRSITRDRLESLLSRGGALGLALEKWQRVGLKVITQSHPEYPEQLERQLNFASPPVLFACGNLKLLGRRSIAVIGSRNADQEDIEYTKNFGNLAAKNNFLIVSGGARGVDLSAMLGALQSNGTAIGVLADSLLREAISTKYHKYLMSNNLLLISPYNPEAGFTIGNAMSRNKYIYCLATNAAVVISSTPNKGGTWNGALEDLNATWVPLWVKRTANANSGNSELVRKGANWIPDNLTSLDCFLGSSLPGTDNGAKPDLFRPKTEIELSPSPNLRTDVSEARCMEARSVETKLKTNGTDESETTSTLKKDVMKMNFYTIFLLKMLDITADGPMKAEDIALKFGLTKSQVNTWLKQGMSDGKINKINRPVRYQSTENMQQCELALGNDS